MFFVVLWCMVKITFQEAQKMICFTANMIYRITCDVDKFSNISCSSTILSGILHILLEKDLINFDLRSLA